MGQPGSETSSSARPFRRGEAGSGLGGSNEPLPGRRRAPLPLTGSVPLPAAAAPVSGAAGGREETGTIGLPASCSAGPGLTWFPRFSSVYSGLSVGFVE